MNNKVFIVLKHEFLLKLRSKSYIILTLTGPILLSLLFVLPALFSSINTGDKRQIAVIDHSGKIGTLLLQRMQAPKDSGSSNGFSKENIELQVAPVDADTTKEIDSLKSLVMTKKLAGFLIIPANAIDTSDLMHSATATLRVRNSNDFSAINFLEEVYKEIVTTEKFKQRGIDPQTIKNIRKSADFETLKLTAGAADSKDSGATFVAGYITGFFIYMAMLLYGATIMRSVVEEKSSRVIEIIASSVKPFELLIGKVLGVGLAALLQVTIWAVMLALLATVGVSSLSQIQGLDLNVHISPFLFIYFIAYFIGGFMIYATLYTAIGATAEQESDLQQLSLPVTLLIMVPIFTLTSVIQSPSSTTSVILSMIPFFSPILMMGRIFSEMPPLWQILLSFALMIVTFFGVLWLAARIYRVGILMYGKKFSLPEVMRWIKYS
ncbi:MAG: ABC transporter permease [Candidatus Kapaibacterium sp.]